MLSQQQKNPYFSECFILGADLGEVVARLGYNKSLFTRDAWPWPSMISLFIIQYRTVQYKTVTYGRNRLVRSGLHLVSPIWDQNIYTQTGL